MINWHIGCSGFYYKHWKGLFYPADLPQKKWFEYYCRYFNTLELNVTFYRFPQLSFLQNWYLKSPVSFRFTVKAPRIITHYKKFKDTAGLITDFYTVINQGLQEKLGCVLFQLPPSFSYSEERLETIINSLDPSFANVVEFRHTGWWRQDVYDELAHRGISFCGMSHPELPSEIIAATDLIYYRMHGETELYASDYSMEQLFSLAGTIKNDPHIKEAYIYFNNDIHVYAVHNAQQLKEIVSV